MQVTIFRSIPDGRVIPHARLDTSRQGQATQVLLLHNLQMSMLCGADQCSIVACTRLHTTLQRQLAQVLHDVGVATLSRCNERPPHVPRQKSPRQLAQILHDVQVTFKRCGVESATESWRGNHPTVRWQLTQVLHHMQVPLLRRDKQRGIVLRTRLNIAHTRQVAQELYNGKVPTLCRCDEGRAVAVAWIYAPCQWKIAQVLHNVQVPMFSRHYKRRTALLRIRPCRRLAQSLHKVKLARMFSRVIGIRMTTRAACGTHVGGSCCPLRRYAATP